MAPQDSIDVLDELLKDTTFKWGMSILGSVLTIIALLAGYIWKTTISNFRVKIEETNNDRHNDAVALRKEMSKMNSNFLKFTEELSSVKQKVAVTERQVSINTQEINELKRKAS